VRLGFAKFALFHRLLSLQTCWFLLCSETSAARGVSQFLEYYAVSDCLKGAESGRKDEGPLHTGHTSHHDIELEPLDSSR